MANDAVLRKRLEFNVKPELHYPIHRDWGLHYKKLNFATLAKKHFDEAIQIQENDLRATLEKSKCNLNIGFTDDAIVDAQTCREIYTEKLYVQLHYNECLYELNEFERALMKRARTRASFKENDVTKGQVDLATLTLNRSIGLEVGPCLYDMTKIICRRNEFKKRKITHSGPLWKILLNDDECDVVSEHGEDEAAEVKNNAEHQRQMNKRKKINLLIHDLYLDPRTSVHIEFLKRLKKCKSTNLSQTPQSCAKIQSICDNYIKPIENFENMLWARQPIYAKRYASTIGNTKYKEINQMKLIHKRNEIRKKAFKHLVEIKKYANANDFRTKLLPYAEEVLCDFFRDLTVKKFPRLFEFVSEICNIISICYLDRLRVPVDLMNQPIKNRMGYLLHLPSERKFEENLIVMSKVFGDKSRYVDSDKPDFEYLRYKSDSDYYAQRSLDAKYQVEKCYLYHEESNLHLKQRKFDAAKQLGKKIVVNANACGNNIWRFLGYLIILKCDVGMGNITDVACRLNYMYAISKSLDYATKHYIKTAKIIQADLMDCKLQDDEIHSQ